MTTWNLVRGARAGGQRGGHRLVPVARQRALDYVRKHRARMGRDGARLGRALRYLDGRPPIPAQLHLQIARYLTRTSRLASGLAPCCKINVYFVKIVNEPNDMVRLGTNAISN